MVQVTDHPRPRGLDVEAGPLECRPQVDGGVRVHGETEGLGDRRRELGHAGRPRPGGGSGPQRVGQDALVHRGVPWEPGTRHLRGHQRRSRLGGDQQSQRSGRHGDAGVHRRGAGRRRIHPGQLVAIRRRHVLEQRRGVVGIPVGLEKCVLGARRRRHARIGRWLPAVPPGDHRRRPARLVEPPLAAQQDPLGQAHIVTALDPDTAGEKPGITGRRRVEHPARAVSPFHRRQVSQRGCRRHLDGLHRRTVVGQQPVADAIVCVGHGGDQHALHCSRSVVRHSCNSDQGHRRGLTPGRMVRECHPSQLGPSGRPDELAVGCPERPSERICSPPPGVTHAGFWLSPCWSPTSPSRLRWSSVLPLTRWTVRSRNGICSSTRSTCATGSRWWSSPGSERPPRWRSAVTSRGGHGSNAVGSRSPCSPSRY